MRRRIVARLLLIIFVFGVIWRVPVSTAKAAEKTAVVSKQKDLQKAIKNKKVTTITVKSKSDIKLIIPKGKEAKTKKIIIDSPKTTLTIKSGAELKELELRNDKSKVTIAKGAKVNKLVSAKKDNKLELIVNGSLKEVVATKKVDLVIRGIGKDVLIRNKAKGTKINTSIKVNVLLEKDAEIQLNKGSEKSEIELENDKVDGVVNNKTSKDVVVKLKDKIKAGKKIKSLLDELMKKEEKESNSESGDEGKEENNSGNSNNGNNNNAGNNNNGNNNNGGNIDEGNKDKYNLVWNDEFTTSILDNSKWVREIREPGWTNNELQRYTDSEENVYIEDGKLILKANAFDNGNETEYSSGKVTTHGKQSFKYGRFEIKAKVPYGKGLWPAIWMMPEDESFYGQWPRCGEIDIMEVLGHETDKMYGTIHYGNPHKESQGTYKKENGSYSDGFHVYAMEWEPGEIRFYIDGQLYHIVNDWYTKVEGGDEIAYPAPFDQPFVIQMNLAVGGNWPGSPDENTDFDQAKFEIDYVRVYQKETYDENVKKPERPPVVLRDPDLTGNYVNNGEFVVDEDLEDEKDWILLTAQSGKASAEIVNESIRITTENKGTVNYAIQLVQPGIPMKQGGIYKLSFEAKADEARTIFTTISAPDRSYRRYLEDRLVKLGTEFATYTYEFTVLDESDPNGRLEFNLGDQESLSAVEFKNIRIEKTDQLVVEEPGKIVSPDGNYIYNGQFDIGEDRMKYWEVEGKDIGSKFEVTNINGIREFKVIVPSNITDLESVKLKQTELGIGMNASYKLSFHAYGDGDKTILARINGQEFEVPINTLYNHYEYSFSTDNSLVNADLEFLLGNSGTTYIDNVRLVEDKMILNGEFNQDMASWEVYVDSGISSFANYSIASEDANKVFAMNIRNTSDADYKIQLKQNNIKLEKDKWYKLNFDAKSTLDRALLFALQRDGSSDDNWQAYGENRVELNAEYQTYELKFKMNYETDLNTILSISMGAVNGIQITEDHTVYIDNVYLEEIEEAELDPIEPIEGDLIKNGDFSEGESYWITQIISPGEGTVIYSDNKVKFDIQSVGVEDWNIQLKQTGIVLEAGGTYEIKANFLSSASREVKIAFLTPEYDWYGGADIKLEADSEKNETFNFTVNKETAIVDFVLSMGKTEGEDTPLGIIEVSNISVAKIK